MVDTQALQITLDEYYFILFQDCVNMMFMAYSILLLTLGEYHQCRIELGSPTLVNLAKFPGTWKIFPRSFQDLSKILQDQGMIVFTMYFYCCVHLVLFDR